MLQAQHGATGCRKRFDWTKAIKHLERARVLARDADRRDTRVSRSSQVIEQLQGRRGEALIPGVRPGAIVSAGGTAGSRV